jgi:hypothetical protein
MPKLKKVIAPIMGRFHDRKTINASRITGILCIKNAKRMLYHASLESKTSNENINKTAMNRIESILGVHKISFLMNIELTEPFAYILY